MQDVLPEGGVIRKLWIGEGQNTATICCGLIRKAGAADSPAAYRTTSSANMSTYRARWTPSFTDFFSTASCAAPPNCVRWAHVFRVRPKPRSASRRDGKVTASARRCCVTYCLRHAIAAFGCCIWPASRRTNACSSLRASSTPNSHSISAMWSARLNRLDRPRYR
jgi:hypothetical protein